MKRTRLTAALLAAGLAVGACGNGVGGGAPTAARGKRLFGATCVTCHGQDAKGLPNLGKNLITSKFIAGKSDAELVAFITKGRPVTDPLNTTGVAFPPKGGNPALTTADLKDIVAYVRTINYGSASPTTGGSTGSTAATTTSLPPRSTCKHPVRKPAGSSSTSTATTSPSTGTSSTTTSAG